MSHPPSLFRAFATVGSYTLLSRVTGFARDTLIATFLGAGLASDAFFVAQRFPNLFRSLFAEGAFSAGFVPIFSQALERDGKDRAKQFADEAFAVLTVVLLFFCAAMMIAMVRKSARWKGAPNSAPSGRASRPRKTSRAIPIEAINKMVPTT